MPCLALTLCQCCAADIDECVRNSNTACGANTDCTNTAGSHTCACKAGFSGDDPMVAGCTPTINCAVSNGGCSPHATCAMLPAGGRSCTCNPAASFVGDGVLGAEGTGCSYTVSGPFQPVDPLPIINKAQLGRSVPVKFALVGSNAAGLSILQATYPRYRVIACPTEVASVDIEEYAADTSGSGGLEYDAAGQKYIYVWKLPSDYTFEGKCLEFVLKLNDDAGTTLKAHFQIKSKGRRSLYL